MSHPQDLRLIKEFSEPLTVIAENKTPQKRLPRRCPEKGVVMLLPNIDPHDQMLLRLPYLLPQLTKLLQPVTIDLIHRNLLLKSFEFGRAYSYLLTGGFFLW
jgi:hypothetical protein